MVHIVSNSGHQRLSRVIVQQVNERVLSFSYLLEKKMETCMEMKRVISGGSVINKLLLIKTCAGSPHSYQLIIRRWLTIAHLGALLYQQRLKLQ